MRRNKLAWILLTGALCLVLYTIVVMRSDNKTTVILGGLDGAFVESDSLTFVDPNAAVETPEPTVDIWPQLDIEDFDNPQYMIVNADNFLSAAYAPAESGKISGTNNQLFDATALPYLEQMLQDCRDAGFTVYVTAAFRSYSEQPLQQQGQPDRRGHGSHGQGGLSGARIPESGRGSPKDRHGGRHERASAGPGGRSDG